MADDSNPEVLNRLPSERAVYLLLIQVGNAFSIDLGRAGTHSVHPGFYLYLDHASEPGGLQSRIADHLQRHTPQGWHLDTLLSQAQVLEVWYTPGPRRMLKHWSELLQDSSRFQTAIRHFGVSEYHRSRITHLFFTKRRPKFDGFAAWMHEVFGTDLEILRVTLTEADA